MISQGLRMPRFAMFCCLQPRVIINQRAYQCLAALLSKKELFYF